MAKGKTTFDDKAHKAAIIEWLSQGNSLRSYCAKPGNPKPSTVIDWTLEDQVFSEQYTRAREAAAELYFDHLDDVSDQAVTAENAVVVAGLRLKADNIKWKLARMAPKRYGDKQQLNVSGEMNVTLFDAEQAARMAQLAYASKSN